MSSAESLTGRRYSPAARYPSTVFACSGRPNRVGSSTAAANAARSCGVEAANSSSTSGSRWPGLTTT